MISAFLFSAYTWPTRTAPATTCSPWAVTPIGSPPRQDVRSLPSRINAADRLPVRWVRLFRCRWRHCDHAWQFGDGSNGSGPAPHHVYATGDRYVVTLTVTDDTGTTAALNTTVDANTPPVAALSASVRRTNVYASTHPGRRIPTEHRSLFALFRRWAQRRLHDESDCESRVRHGHLHCDALRPGQRRRRRRPDHDRNRHQYAAGRDVHVRVQRVHVWLRRFGRGRPRRLIQSYRWTFGDGIGGSAATTSHGYAAAGTYVVDVVGLRQ